MRAASIISALTAVSRVLGLVREQVFAALLGAGFHADAFNAAFRIPNLLRDLFAEGALSAAFVPTYARALAEGGPSRAHQLASRLLTLVSVVLALIVVVGFLLATPLVHALAPGFAAIAGKTEETVRLTRVMLPFLPLVSLAAVAMGMLNAEERFGMAGGRPRDVQRRGHRLGGRPLGAWATVRPRSPSAGRSACCSEEWPSSPSRSPRSARRGLAVPSGMGPCAIRGCAVIFRLMAPGDGRPGRGAGQHLREHDLRLARARRRLLAAVRLPHPLPADRRHRRGGGDRGHDRPRARGPRWGTWRASARPCAARWPRSPS